MKRIILRFFVFPESGMLCINEKEDKYDKDGAVGGFIKLSYFFIDDLSNPALLNHFGIHLLKEDHQILNILDQKYLEIGIHWSISKRHLAFDKTNKNI